MPGFLYVLDLAILARMTIQLYTCGMKWYEIAVYTTDAGTEPVCNALLSAGLDGCSIEESKDCAAAFLRESALYWDFADMDKIGTDHPCVKSYIEVSVESEAKIAEAKKAVEALKDVDFGVDMGSLAVTVTERDDEDWANNWKKYYKPLNIGQRLLVLPSWEPKPETERAILKLDPGLAFGTGAHATTRMCLELLEGTVKPGDRIIDLGCGSGILSIAGNLLGAEHAIAVDIDPIAETIARENADMNGIAPKDYDIEIGDVLTDKALRKKIDCQYDLVVANIVADVIMMLAPYAYTLCKPGAPFIVSGIIDTRRDEVKESLIQDGFVIDEVCEGEGWVAMKTHRPAVC